MEYLVRRYRIDIYLWQDLLKIFINYSNTEYYAKIVRLCRSSIKEANIQTSKQLTTLIEFDFPIQKEDLFYLLKQSNYYLMNELIKTSKTLHGLHKQNYQKWIMNAIICLLEENNGLLKQITQLIQYDLDSKQPFTSDFFNQLAAYYLLIINNYGDQLTKQWKTIIFQNLMKQEKFLFDSKLKLMIACNKLNEQDLMDKEILSLMVQEIVQIKKDQQYTDIQIKGIQVIIQQLDNLSVREREQIMNIIKQTNQQTIELFTAKLIVLIEQNKNGDKNQKFEQFISQIEINKNIINYVKQINFDSVQFLQKYCNSIDLYEDDFVDRIKSKDNNIRSNCIAEIYQKIKDQKCNQETKNILIQLCIQALDQEEDIQSLRLLLNTLQYVDKFENVSEEQIIRLYKIITQKQSHQIYELCQLLKNYIQKQSIHNQNIDKVQTLLDIQLQLKQGIDDRQIQQLQQIGLFPYQSQTEIISASQINIHKKSIILIQIICNLNICIDSINQFIITQIQEQQTLQDLLYKVFNQYNFQNQMKCIKMLSTQQTQDFISKLSIEQVLQIINEATSGQNLQILTQRLIELIPEIEETPENMIALITLPGTYVKYNQMDLFNQIKQQHLKINQVIQLFWDNYIQSLSDVLQLLKSYDIQLTKQQSYYFMQYVYSNIKQCKDQEMYYNTVYELLASTFDSNFYHDYAYELIRRVLGLSKQFNDNDIIEGYIKDLLDQKYETYIEQPDQIVDNQEIEATFTLIDYLKLIHAKFENGIPTLIWFIAYKDDCEEQINQLCYLRQLCDQQKIIECQKTCKQLLSKVVLTPKKIASALFSIPITVIKQLQQQNFQDIKDIKQILSNLFTCTQRDLDETQQRQIITELLKLYIRIVKESLNQGEGKDNQPQVDTKQMSTIIEIFRSYDSVDYNIIVNDLSIIARYIQQECLISIMAECYKNCVVPPEVTKETISVVLDSYVDDECIGTITEIVKMIIQTYLVKIPEQDRVDDLSKIIGFIMEKVPEYLAGVLIFLLTEGCTEIDPVRLISKFDIQIQLGTLSVVLGYSFECMEVMQYLQEQTANYTPLSVLDSFVSESIENKIDNILQFIKQVIYQLDQIPEEIEASQSSQLLYSNKQLQPYVFFIDVLMQRNCIDRTYSLALQFVNKLNKQQMQQIFIQLPVDFQYIRLYVDLLKEMNEEEQTIELNLQWIYTALENQQFFNQESIHELIQQIINQQFIYNEDIKIKDSIQQLLLKYMQILFETNEIFSFSDVITYNLQQIIKLIDVELIELYQPLLNYIKNLQTEQINIIIQSLVQQPHCKYISFIFEQIMNLDLEQETMDLIVQNLNVKMLLDKILTLIKQKIENQQIINLRQIFETLLDYKKIQGQQNMEYIIDIVKSSTLELFRNLQLGNIMTTLLQEFSEDNMIKYIEELIQKLYYKGDLQLMKKIFNKQYKKEEPVIIIDDYKKYSTILSGISKKIMQLDKIKNYYDYINQLLFQTIETQNPTQIEIYEILVFYLQQITYCIKNDKVDETFIEEFCQNIEQINQIDKSSLVNERANNYWLQIGECISQDQFLQQQLYKITKVLINCQLGKQIQQLFDKLDSKTVNDLVDLKNLVPDLKELQEKQEQRQFITKVLQKFR